MIAQCSVDKPSVLFETFLRKVFFLNDAAVRQHILTNPEDWDLLYFGGTHRTKKGQFIPESINEYFVKGKRILTTHCYAVKDTMYDVILNRVLEKEPLFENTIDGYLAVSIQPICKTFAFHPPIAWQKAGHSDVQNGWRDYPHLKTGAFRG